MCAGIPKGKSSNITSVDGFEGVKGLNVPARSNDVPKAKVAKATKHKHK
jgi:hypothetical protein